VVHADSSAVWSRSIERDREQVVLERGALFIRVEHHISKFVVVLPDGELEDIGTTFSVSVQDGHTTRVSVREGRVVLRLRGLPPVGLAAGETWNPPVQACAPSAAPAAVEPPPARRATEKRDPAADFRAAIAVLEAGKHAEAAAAFARFGARYPRDPRAQDAAYLRVIALQKLGAADGELKRAAQQYLSRFPAGLRRVEVERLLSRA
jgi:ferric-dicitrate binding protein FerR (iron transport regulator)